MIETLFAVSLPASLGGFLYLRFASVPSARQPLLRGVLELTVPLTLTSALFAVLQWWVRSVENSVTATTSIRDIERAIGTIRNDYMEPLVMPAWSQFFVLALILLAGGVWPQVRALFLVRFKAATRWMTRVQIAATLLVSFTFFGSVQATNASHAEVRLRQNISKIQSAYVEAFAAADETLAKAAAVELLSNPAWQPALAPLAETLANQQSTDQEIAAARAAVVNADVSHLRDFKVTAEEIPASHERVAFVQRDRAETLPGREKWTQAEATRLASDAEALRRETVTELVTAAVDTGREALAKTLVAQFFAGSVAEGFAAVVLDASVLYDFRHVVADATNSLVDRVLRRRQSLKSVFAETLPPLRVKAAALAPRAIETAQSTYEERATASRQTLAATQQVRRDTLQEYREKANAQASREWRALAARVTAKLDPDLALAGESVLLRLVDRDEPAMARISRIRTLEKDLRFDGTRLAVLSEKERELGGSQLFNEVLGWRIERMLATERYAYRDFTMTGMYDSEKREEWEKIRRVLVLQQLGEGKTTIEPYQWEMASANFRWRYSRENPNRERTERDREMERSEPREVEARSRAVP
jgi:hypothetical protein